jgi:hypothetical protein
VQNKLFFDAERLEKSRENCGLLKAAERVSSFSTTTSTKSWKEFWQFGGFAVCNIAGWGLRSREKFNQQRSPGT